MTYPAATQARVAAEVAAAPPTATWPGWLVDYDRLRRAARACAR